jgi:hypothetical protein
MVRMSAFIGQRQQTSRVSFFNDFRQCSKGSRQRAIKKLIDQRSSGAPSKKFHLVHTNLSKSASGFFFAHRSISLTRSETPPEVVIFRSAVGREDDEWLLHMLQQSTAGGSLVVRVSDYNQRASQEWFE